MKNRPEHLASEIQKILAEEVQADFENRIITISDVVVSGDLMKVSVWVKILGENCFGDIVKNSKKYRDEIGKRLKLRRVPEVKFINDNIVLPSS